MATGKFRKDGKGRVDCCETLWPCGQTERLRGLVAGIDIGGGNRDNRDGAQRQHRENESTAAGPLGTLLSRTPKENCRIVFYPKVFGPNRPRLALYFMRNRSELLKRRRFFGGCHVSEYRGASKSHRVALLDGGYAIQEADTEACPGRSTDSTNFVAMIFGS
ncbi:hypothetical protein DFH08DRAFT_828431 [Mycena albidolilacea]|uniref:Uncharacterized protein n=1 Tax=Mycena albidolilacea TaxID=1033008 RepID=A0AAD6YWS5_9AGAR|nr:hypothetical protein DFH08DRAFT_828431 [Mycena albidolilacea]